MRRAYTICAAHRMRYIQQARWFMGADRNRGIDKHLPLRRVEFHILLSLSAGDRHGYGIIQDIEARGETAVPDVGTMYRALARMLESGLIQAGTRRTAPRGTDACGAARRPAREGDEVSGPLAVSERWFRLLLRFYPPDFRDDMG